MKTNLSRVLAGLVAALLSLSCAKKTSEDTKFKVALLSPGPISDQGWNASAYEGLLKIKATLGAEVAQTESKNPLEFEEGFRHYASQGYALVFGHGFEFQDAAAKAGMEFPKTVFISTSGNSTHPPNVSGITLRLEEATYLAGRLAGLLTKTGKAGMIGGMEIPALKPGFNAFSRGFMETRPGGRVSVIYLGSWEDAAAGAEAAKTLIGSGCDFLIHNADAAGLGVFKSAKDSGKVLVFGTNKDQNSVAPDVILASAVLDIPRAFLSVAQNVKAGTFKGEITELGIANGLASLVLNPKLENRITEAARKDLSETEAKIRSGQLRVPTEF